MGGNRGHVQDHAPVAVQSTSRHRTRRYPLPPIDESAHTARTLREGSHFVTLGVFSRARLTSARPFRLSFGLSSLRRFASVHKPGPAKISAACWSMMYVLQHGT